MKPLALLFVAAGLMLSATVAQAQPESGWVVAARTASPTFEADFSEGLFQRFDDSTDIWALGAGYRFGRHLSVEAWFQDRGDFDGRGGLCAPLTGTCPSVLVPSRASLEAVSLRLAGHLPVGRRVDLYAFAGPIDWTLDIERFPGEDLRSLPPFEDSGTDLSYGGGVGITIGKGLSAFGEYEGVDYDGFDLDTGPWLGLRWRS